MTWTGNARRVTRLAESLAEGRTQTCAALIVTLVVFGAVPWMFYYPFTGLMFWVGSGISTSPAGLRFRARPAVRPGRRDRHDDRGFSKEPKKFPANGVTITWLLFTFWVCITTMFAFAQA